jgi:hypothetical protein
MSTDSKDPLAAAKQAERELNSPQAKQGSYNNSDSGSLSVPNISYRSDISKPPNLESTNPSRIASQGQPWPTVQQLRAQETSARSPSKREAILGRMNGLRPRGISREWEVLRIRLSWTGIIGEAMMTLIVWRGRLRRKGIGR